MRRILFSTSVLLASFTATALAQSADARSCYARAYAEYAEAQREYQRTLEQMVVARDSFVLHLAASARAEQVARIDVRARAVEVLLRDSISALRLDRSRNEWLDWSSELSATLRRRDTVFARLDRASGSPRIPVTKDENREHLRYVVRLVLETPAHREAMSRVTRLIQEPVSCEAPG